MLSNINIEDIKNIALKAGKAIMEIYMRDFTVEYKDDKSPLTEADINDILDYLCRMANQREVFYLWRPFLKDSKDDMVLELAVSGQCQAIITYNKKDFVGTDQFGLQVMTPQEFLEAMGKLK